MASAAPNTKDWKAWQDLQPVRPQPRLFVTGEVQTSNSNQTPELTERTPSGINPAILQLQLTIVTRGTGNTVMGWRTARFEKDIKKDQYSSVEIFWESDKIAGAEVKTTQ
jgi:hypothetical protein